MEKMTNYRVKEDYLAEDGRHIEVWKKVGVIPVSKLDESDPETEETKEVSIFYGVMLLGTQFGPKEIKFAMPEAKTLEEAFAQYGDAAKAVVKELEKRQEEMMRERGQKIITAPAAALNEIDRKIIT